jgi:regulator of sirC expression with transglutaminase-like and TPR domain
VTVPEPPPTPSARFAGLVGRPAHLVPLDEAAFVIAAHDHAVDVGAQLARLDRLAAECAEPSVAAVVDLLFRHHGFAGDQRDYHHPDNSFLDRVLDRRRGLPILLSILTAEVGARAGVCLAYVAMPGHVLLRDCEAADRFVDPFHGGALLAAKDCRKLFAAVNPTGPWDDAYLEPVDNLVILRRVVANLVHSYASRHEARALAWTLRLQSLAAGESAN